MHHHCDPQVTIVVLRERKGKKVRARVLFNMLSWLLRERKVGMPKFSLVQVQIQNFLYF